MIRFLTVLLAFALAGCASGCSGERHDLALVAADHNAQLTTARPRYAATTSDSVATANATAPIVTRVSSQEPGESRCGCCGNWGR